MRVFRLSSRSATEYEGAEGKPHTRTAGKSRRTFKPQAGTRVPQRHQTVNAVEFRDVSKSYAIYDSPGDRLRELLSPRRKKRHRDIHALSEVSFEVKPGETFCIVGENGSG